MEWSDESLLALAGTSLEYSAFVSRKPKRRVVRRLLYATAASEVALYMSTRLVSDELARALACTSLEYPAAHSSADRPAAWLCRAHG